METPEPTRPGPSAKDKPTPAPGLPGAPSGQASPRLTLGPVILPQEQGLPSTVFLKALPIPLYHTVPPGGLQPRAPLMTGSLDGGGVPFILSPLLPPEGPGPAQVGKPGAPTLTVNIVGAVPVLSPGPALGSPGKARSAGRYLCPHCGRDCLKPSVLEKHIRSHTGERPFPCATCRIAFKTQSNLYKHRRTQTHLHNSRLSLEAEGGRHGLPEEDSGAREPSRAEGSGEGRSWGAERALPPGAHPSPAAQSLDAKLEAASCPGATPAHREDPADRAQMASPGLPLASPQPRWKLLEPKPCPLPRQQETTVEKPWDSKASEGRLRKCESTDSGYLSRSDSAEQPPVTSSPLHSLSEHSAESEGEGGPGPGLGGVEAEPGAPGSNLELEKKQLEERIARLISHNQAVVDDPQLDHVRPRKTVLSKQGSIDLPMPYTYKDSFHFDIRALEPGRRRAVRSPAPSTFTPLDKSRPLFFHSVPTQLSTTVECVPVTRSNSLPLVEGSRTWPEPRDLQDIFPGTQKPPSPRAPAARPARCAEMTLAVVPSSHPRALVRQAAVEDAPGPAEELEGPGPDGKGRAAGKKGRPRKAKMFSQEKWQVYGHETFQRIYQKMKSYQGGHKSREGRTEPDPPPREEAAGAGRAAPAQDSAASVPPPTSAEAQPGAGEPRSTPESSVDTQPARERGAAAGAGGGSEPPWQGGTRSPSPPSGGASPCLGARGPPLPPDGTLLEPPRGEAVTMSPWAQAAPRRPGGGSGKPKLPSERKKLRVEGAVGQEQVGPPGAETPGAPGQAASLPPQTQDSHPQGASDGPQEPTEHPRGPLAPPRASSATPAAALTHTGPREGGPRPLPVARVSGPPLQPAPPPGAALAHSTFPPKYLLRLPPREPHPALPVPPGPAQARDSPCTSRQLRERAPAVGSAPGSPPPPDPVSGPAPGETEGLLEDPSRSRPRDRRGETQAGHEKGDGPRTEVPVTKDAPSLAPGPPWEKAPLPPSPTCLVHGARDSLRQLCQSGTRAKTQDPGGLLNPWLPPQEPGRPRKNVPEDALPKPPADLSLCAQVQPSALLPALPGPQSQAPSLPEPFLSPHSGTPGGCRAQSPFPSLRAEPRLTWCCLSRSLPLPAEQERAASVYSALYCPGGRLRARSPQALPEGTGGRTRTRTSPGGRKPVPQMPELCYPAIPGMRGQDLASDPARKKGPWRRRAKASRGSGRQKRPRFHAQRCEGSFWQSRAQLRAVRLRKPRWAPRGRGPPPPPRGQEPRGTPGRASSSEVAGLSLQAAPSDRELPPGCRSEEGKEEDFRLLSEAFAPSESSRTPREMDKFSLKGISPSAGEHGGCSPLDMADASGLSVPPCPGSPPGKAGVLLQDKGLDFVLLPSQDQDSADPSARVSSDAQESSPCECTGTAPHQLPTTSAAPVWIPVGVQGADEQDPSPAAEAARPPSSPARPAAGPAAQALWTETPFPAPKTVGVAALGSPGKASLEMPASGLSSTSAQQEEGRPQAGFPPGAGYPCGGVAVPSPAPGQGSGKRQSALIPPRGCALPPSLGQPSELPEAPSRSIRKRSLEGMRKQTRVELSDTSSDDEDRLVIEI